MLIFKTKKSDFIHPVVFLSKQVSSDGMGHGGTVTWVDSGIYELAVIWPLKAKERLEGMKLEHQVTHRLIVHYRDGIKANMRVRKEVDNRIFDIISILNMSEMDEEIQFLVREVTDV